MPHGGVVVVDGAASIDAAAGILGVVRAGAVAAPLPVARTPPERAAALALLDPVLVLDSDDERAGRADAGGPGRGRADLGHHGRAEGRRAAARRARRERRRVARGAPAGDRLAAGAGPRARGGDRPAVAGRRRPRPDADRRPRRPGGAARGPARRPGDSHVSLVPAQLARLLDASGDAAPPATLRACAPRRRDDPARARDPGARRRLAGRPDLWPERGGLRGDGPVDGRGARGAGQCRPAAPGCHASGSTSRARTASARSSSTPRHDSPATSASRRTKARSGRATSAPWTPPGG